MSILKTPKDFLDLSIPIYPSQNKSKNFEAYFYDFFIDSKFNSEYIYIPIQWTNYLISHNYGKSIDELVNFVEKSLDPEKRYFTIVQYAGGPLVTLPNTTIFSMGGVFNTKIHRESNIVPIPLIYENEIIYKNNKRKYSASYVGRPTHDVRLKLEKKLKNTDNFFVKNLESMDSNISTKNQRKFFNLINDSYFSLCPRGYGPTSFRLYESIQAGTIPIYISDDFFLPYSEFLDWNKFSVLLKPRKISSIPKIVEEIIDSRDYADMHTNLKTVSKDYFNFQYVSEYIKSIVEEKKEEI